MSKQRTPANIEPRYVDDDSLAAYTSLGRNSALRIGEESCASIRLGRRTVYDLRKIDEYMEKQRTSQHAQNEPTSEADHIAAAKAARAEYNAHRSIVNDGNELD